ncbi:hypothetical protein [Chryseobacterium vrystaatense]|uniref:hypothetical protein n=1 Tax=Chryseobacterium vrystaatense TaxID=307480 RepID=UPI00093363F0|nr:hypothetical protein [Chryseobacterium vrystaatense]
MAEEKRFQKITFISEYRSSTYFPGSKILGVSLAFAQSSKPGRYVHFYLFLLTKKGYPLPSLTQKTVLPGKFSPITDDSSAEFHFEK